MVTFTEEILNPFQLSVAFYIETSHWICNANQMTGFYMKCKTGLKCVNRKLHFLSSVVPV